MKPTNQLKKEILKVYDTWLHSYLNGDVKTYDSFFNDAFHFIGSTHNEEFLDRKHTTDFFKATAEQFAGKTQLRNENKIIEQFGELVFITHLFDAWFLGEVDWTFYGRFRFSNILKKDEAGWRFVYQHYSVPDSKAQEGETIGYNQVSAENLMLREAVKRRTVELEEKNRELAIEAALEKVRSRTMAMQKSEELSEISFLLDSEVRALGIKTRGCAFNIYGENESSEWFSSEQGTLPKYKTPRESVFLRYYEAGQRGEIMHIEKFEDEACAAHYEYMCTLPVIGDALKEMIENGVSFPTRQIDHATYFKYGYLLFITLEPAPEAHDIFKRFAKVFEQTYTRFLDLQKAEAQARESQIELGLERVRARAMAMQHSNELSDLVATVLNELTKLDFSLTWCIINIINEADNSNMLWAINPEGGTEPESYYMKFEDYPYQHAAIKAWKAKKTKFVYILEGKEKKIYDDYLYNETEFKKFSNKAKKANRALDRYVASFTFSNFGGLQTVSSEPLSEENLDILARFGKVFDMTYTRFNDLQKAEAQAKEAQIEAALEKVRSRTMAMQRSDELPEAANTLFLEVQALGIPAWSCGYNILSEDKKSSICNMSSEGELQDSFVLPLTQHKSLKPWHKAIKNEEEFFVYGQKGKDLVAHYKYMESLPELKGTFELFEKAGINLPIQQFNHLVRFNEGFLLFITYEEVPEAHDIFKRFGKVFEQTYTRFLDLQKAEAQAREAEIELALERVRSRSMAMHSSNELVDTSDVMLAELKKLNIQALRIGICTIDKETEAAEIWSRSEIKGKIEKTILGIVPKGVHSIFDEMVKAWKEKQPSFSSIRTGKEVKKYYVALSPYLSYPLPETYNEKEAISAFFFPEGSLNVVSNEPLQKEDTQIMLRFAKVFGQIYQRFLDLQKAEAQARESEIELALERVRARSMGMQKSEELKEVIKLVYDQFIQLNIHIDHAGFIVDYKPKGDWHFWIADKQEIPSKITHPYFDSVWANQFDEAKEKGRDFFATNLNFEEKNKFYKVLLNLIPSLSEEAKDFYFSCPGLAGSTVLLDNVGLYIENFSGIPYSDNENATLMRFGKVFQQTYTRFLDLQKAEAQARESEIELALERVRARTMAMQHSDELQEAAILMFKQVENLGVPVFGSGFNIWDKDRKAATSWMAGKNRLQPSFKTSSSKDIFRRIHAASQKGESLFVEEQSGKALKAHYKYMVSIPEFKEVAEKIAATGLSLPNFQIMHCAFFSQGYLMFISFEPAKDAYDIFKRFAKVFEQTYTRFLDLQKAEAQAREAQIELGLERVRARAMAMQHSDELSDLVATVLNELTKLDFSLTWCIINIINEDDQSNMVWATNPEGGTEPESYYMKFEDYPFHYAMMKAWKEQKTKFVYVLEGNEKKIYDDYLYNETEFKRFSNKVKKANRALDKYVASFTFSNFGGLQTVASEPLSDENLDILARFGKVFDLTYTRFNDLQNAEAHALQAKEDLINLQKAKKKAEDTLSELQETQKQLIQAEKMASLGELTAGIAHEIQNPLNFVNNFSEVSKELLEEMMEELANGDTEEVKAIANDIIQNLEKINHHGKRADGIVKGMLQHSRSSSGVKEPTDINALADEYLRLAYHGLRAKDKLFNATLETDFDESINTINIISQDIGRVILNLITNAFYVVDEKKKTSTNATKQVSYEPTVSVSTKKLNDKVLISVKDNGNGIPQKVLDKIFQPFFTTKPTGQGTGLGLSLSFDIVKAHGGEIEVNTKENEGTEFTIVLPM